VEVFCLKDHSVQVVALIDIKQVNVLMNLNATIVMVAIGLINVLLDHIKMKVKGNRAKPLKTGT
jgi:hypothetical protein